MPFFQNFALFCIILSACNSHINSENEHSFGYEVVSFSELPRQSDSDSTFYTWSGNRSDIWSPDSVMLDVKLDSIFTGLLANKISPKKAWYQPANVTCGDLTYAPPPILVVRLHMPDKRIENHEFTQGLANFHDCPELKYRQYTF